MNTFFNTLFCLLAGLSLVLPGSAWAQTSALTVHGRVLEKGSRKPLQGAVLVVKEIDTLSTVSDEKGNFSLTLPGPGSFTVLASALGADEPESLPVQLDKDVTPPALTFYLLPSTVLAEVVVTAERNPNQVSKTVIKGDELRQIAGSSGDPLKGLQSLRRRCGAPARGTIFIMQTLSPSARCSILAGSAFLMAT
jgi:hypothetical protein